MIAVLLGMHHKMVAIVTAEELASKLIAEIGSPFRLRIGGFPACGKTTISNLLRTRIPSLKHIESEAWILPLVDRISLDMSGANPNGYERQRSIEDLEQFLDGRPLTLTTYDHKIGDHIPGQIIRSEPNVSFILDGTLFSLADYDKIAPACILLKPKKLEDWLQASIRRDVDTRYFSEAEATRHNMRKARDLQQVIEDSPAARVVLCSFSPDAYLYEYPDAKE
jgi:uridine kinase